LRVNLQISKSIFGKRGIDKMDGNFNNGQYQGQPQYQNGYYNAYPNPGIAYTQPVIPGLRETVREALKSMPFLIMAITFSASLLMSAINMIYYMVAVTVPSSFFMLALLIPMAITTIGLWQIYLGAGKNTPVIKGFGMLRGICILCMILFIFLAVISGIATVLFAIGAGILSTLDSSDYVNFGEIAAIGIGIIIVLYALFFVLTILAAVYYGKLNSSIKRIEEGANLGYMTRNISTYVIVFTVIGCASSVLTAIATIIIVPAANVINSAISSSLMLSQYGLGGLDVVSATVISAISGVVSAVFVISMAVFLMDLRKKLSALGVR
jgi:hypothetical protein